MSASKKNAKNGAKFKRQKINAMKKAEFKSKKRAKFKSKKDERDKRRKINGADDEMRGFWCLKTFLISRFLR